MRPSADTLPPGLKEGRSPPALRAPVPPRLYVHDPCSLRCTANIRLCLVIIPPSGERFTLPTTAREDRPKRGSRPGGTSRALARFGGRFRAPPRRPPPSSVACLHSLGLWSKVPPFRLR